MHVRYEVKEDGHRCHRRYDESACGEAINECVEDTDGRFWVGNDEYASQVDFCPYCGTKATTEPRFQHVTAARYQSADHEQGPGETT